MSKGQDEFVKDKIIYHIVTKPPSIEQVVGKYWQDTNVVGEFDPRKNMVFIKLRYYAFWFWDALHAFLVSLLFWNQNIFLWK